MTVPNPIVFILGAGASTEAGVPTMRGLVDDFAQTVTLEDEEFHLFDGLRVKLSERAADRIVDVELLLASLERAGDLENDPSAALLQLRSDVRVVPEVARSLASKLKDFLRSACADPITTESVAHLLPLAMFAKLQGELDVITLNYDCSVEAVADQESIHLVDGFRFFWSPEAEFGSTSESTTPLIRLYKLHGSVTWYRRETYEWVKVPLRPVEREAFRFFTGEELTEVMVYPTVQKDIGATPLTDLMLRAQTVLKSAAVIAIIGYSLRDERIRDTLFEALARSRSSQIVLVDPDAEALAAAWLAAPRVRDRTLPLPRTAGSALAGNYLHKVIVAIVSAQQRTQDAEAQKPASYGQARRLYREAIRSYYEIRHIAAVRSIVEREEATNPEPIATSDQHPLPQLSPCTAFALVDGVTRETWWRLLVPLLYWLEADRLRVIQTTPTISPRPGQPELSTTAPIHFVDEDVSAMQTLLKTFMALTHNGQQSTYGYAVSKMIRQLERLVELVALQYTAEPAKSERLRILAPDYIDEASPSEFAAALATTPEPPNRGGLHVDWGGQWPTIHVT